MPSSLGETLKASMRFNDLIFVSHEREFPAHRLVVMTHSPVLEKLIQSGKPAEVGGKCIISVDSAFSPSTVEHFIEYLYTESYTCPFAKAIENETTATSEPIHSATTAMELADGDTIKAETSDDLSLTSEDLISLLDDEDMHPVIDTALAPPNTYVDSSHKKDQNLVVQEALVQHLRVLGLANIYQVQTLADTARGYIASILSHAASAGPVLQQLVEEMKTPEKFDRQVLGLLYTCIKSYIQGPFGHRLLAGVFALCDTVQADLSRQKSANKKLQSDLAVAQVTDKKLQSDLAAAQATNEKLQSDLAAAQAELRASKDRMTERHRSEQEQLTKVEDDLAKAEAQLQEMHTKLDNAAPGLEMLKEVHSAQERLAVIEWCRNTSCCATYDFFKGRVQVERDLSVTLRCQACLCRN